MARPARQRRPAIDLEEIAPDRFLVHNPRVTELLKGEGTLSGRLFELTTWRREGLLARLRGRGLQVRTFADLVAALPVPPPPPPINGMGRRSLTSPIEQISHFDFRRLRWHPLAPDRRDGTLTVVVYDGWVLRRRKGRGRASYHLAFVERGGDIGLKPLDETEALLAGYAQAMALDDRPLLVERRSDLLLLPDIEVPPPHRALLRRITTESDEGPLVDEGWWPLVQQVFRRLGVRLVDTDA
jgi:hypothetical protein